jgi:hypothetical protein
MTGFAPFRGFRHRVDRRCLLDFGSIHRHLRLGRGSQSAPIAIVRPAWTSFEGVIKNR